MKRTPAEVLAEARRRDSRDKRARALAVVDALAARGEPVTFATVAKTAGVSSWLVYAEGVREHIEAARARQAATDRRAGAAVTGAGTAGLKTDLELARQEITALRGERDRLKGALRRQLGQQLDQAAAGDLVARIEELTQQNEALTVERDTLRRENAMLAEKLEEAEEDLIVARTSLRQMIRAENRTD
ncbi:DUF6262 family protein [Kitasatospora sp. NPDC088779]|uniref:DUF6262 family protein n=1 Tax=Kitasatospora sp. NPDC088779 TaxID=3154964 RepID=UPI00343D0FC8